MSARFNPAARTRTRTRSRVARGGSGTSRTFRPSTPPNETIVMALKVISSSPSNNPVGDSNEPRLERKCYRSRPYKRLNIEIVEQGGVGRGQTGYHRRVVGR